MKFVKTITLLLTFCVMAFSSDMRVAALGGNPGFWADDDANVGMFPATVNNLDMVQVSGAGNNNGSVNVIWGEGTTWGFGFDGAGDSNGNDWLNLMWGNGTYGAVFSLGSSSADNGLTGDANVATSTFDIGASFGMNMDFGELGVNFSSGSSDDGVTDTDDPSTFGLGVNLRRGQDVWLFDNMLVGFSMDNETQGDATGANMDLDCSLFTSLPAGDGVTANFALGFGYWSHTHNDGTEGAEDMTMSSVKLPEATLGVEADVTDWATVRFGMNHSYVLAGSNGDASWTGTTDVYGDSNFGWNFGLGFDYGSFTLDMVINEDIFNNPVHYVTGRNTSDLTSSGATLTWKF